MRRYIYIVGPLCFLSHNIMPVVEDLNSGEILEDPRDSRLVRFDPLSQAGGQVAARYTGGSELSIFEGIDPLGYMLGAIGSELGRAVDNVKRSAGNLFRRKTDTTRYVPVRVSKRAPTSSSVSRSSKRRRVSVSLPREMGGKRRMSSALVRRSKRQRVPRSITDVTRIAKLPYADYRTIQINNSTATSDPGYWGYWQLSCNNGYKPDVNATGHQPRGFDQYAQFYNKGVVLGSWIKMTLLPNTGEQVGQIVFSGWVDFTAYSGFEPPYDVGEERWHKTKYLLDCTRQSATDSGSVSYGSQIRLKYAHKRMNGTGAATTDSSAVFDTQSDSVGQEWRFNYQVWAPEATTSTHTVKCFIEASYMILFFDPKDPALSTV